VQKGRLGGMHIKIHIGTNGRITRKSIHNNIFIYIYPFFGKYLRVRSLKKLWVLEKLMQLCFI